MSDYPTYVFGIFMVAMAYIIVDTMKELFLFIFSLVFFFFGLFLILNYLMESFIKEGATDV